MNRHGFVISVMVAAAALVNGGCGGDTSTSTTGATSVPTAAALASSLITVNDYAGKWTVNLPPGADPSGVIADSQQALLPTVGLCDRASAPSRAAVKGLRWKAGRQLDLTVKDPITPPNDRKGHMIFVQEYLTSGDQASITSTFDAVRDGMKACLGVLPAGDEGPGTATAMRVPNVGDDRYGVLTVVEEAGGWAKWRLSTTLIRRGQVLVFLNVVDIIAGVPPQFSDSDIDGFTMTAVAKL